ncbi:MAG TPA: deoxyribonuclease IV [Fimbriimonadaceae bacterium]|nr:deoxyribonuclease IV [Fimbriimonadaceae bacterium]
MLIGAHMSTKGGLGNALRKGKEIGCTAVQVFTSSPQQWYAKEVSPDLVADFRRAQEETGIRSVVSHDTYLINLCAPTPEIRDKSLHSLKKELLRCGQYGIEYVVSHIGSTKGQDHAESMVTAAEGIKEVLAETPESVLLLMETTAGQGSSLNSRFEELAMFFDLCNHHPRLGVCLDTCHVFVAGYDIRTQEGYDQMWSKFDGLVGIERLKVIHCNDSKRELGSKVDRHEDIGDGCLGIEPFRLLMNDARFERVPILLETPDGEAMHEENLRRLRELVQTPA